MKTCLTNLLTTQYYIVIIDLLTLMIGMHGLLASQSCYHSVLPLVCVHCGPVVDFFITKQTSLHPFDFVRNLFHLLVYNYL